MTIELLDINELRRQYEKKSLRSIVKEFSDENIEEITIAIHSAFDISYSEATREEKDSYLKNTENFLKFCKRKKIRILHFRDMLLIPTDKVEPTLSDKFGIQADYEIPTFPNTGIPLELAVRYAEQKLIYGIFFPDIYSSMSNIQVVNGIGCFTDECFVDGFNVMEKIASREVRIVKECLLSKSTKPFNSLDYINDHAFLPDKTFVYSFNGKEVKRIS